MPEGGAAPDSDAKPQLTNKSDVSETNEAASATNDEARTEPLRHDKTGVPMARTSIVDDEAEILDLVLASGDEGFKTYPRDRDSALAESAPPPGLVSSLWLQAPSSRLAIARADQEGSRDVPCHVYGLATAKRVAAIKRGAYDFIEKPFKSDRLILVATRALETSRLKREVKELKQLAPTASVLTGRSACMNQLRQTIDRAAKANSRILIVGPSGSGKELAARTLHNASGRAEGPFVVINAAASTPERMEVELFGIEQSTANRRAGRAWKSPRRHRCSSTRSPTPRNPEQTGVWSSTFQRSGGTAKFMSLLHHSRRRATWRKSREGRFRDDSSPLSVVPIRASAVERARNPELIDYSWPVSRRQPSERQSAGLNGGCSRMSARNVRQLRNNVERVMILAGGGHEAISPPKLPQDWDRWCLDAESNNCYHIIGALREARECSRVTTDRADHPFLGQHSARRIRGMERSA